MRRQLTLVALLFVTASACATTGGLSRSDIIDQYPQISSLHTALLDAEKAGAANLSPDNYASAREDLDLAIEAAQAAKKEKANTIAERGLSALSKAKASMATFREVMDEVLETRDRALAASARSLYPDEMNKVEQQLFALARTVEQGDVDEAREERPELLALYSDLELKALKKGSVEAAKAAIAEAEKADADKWAPKTIKLAREEVKLVTSVLDADRTQTDKASSHAAKTVWLAGRAMAITTLAKMFEKEDYTPEDIVLWYQGQLEELGEPLGQPLPFDKDNRELVLAVRDDIAGLKKGLEDTRGVIKQYQAQLEALVATAKQNRADMETAMSEVLNADRKDLVQLRKKYAEYLSSEGKSTALSEQREVELRQKFEEIRLSFSEKEAVVSLQDGNILIIPFDIEFGKNNVDISARNYGLLNKIALAVQKLPDAAVMVSGHTDSKGKAKKNQEISQQRADAILRFLTDVGGVAKERVTATGHGSQKPMASNETAAGRKQNRRIEVLLVTD